MNIVVDLIDDIQVVVIIDVDGILLLVKEDKKKIQKD